MHRIEATVNGRVQLVMFRDFVNRKAQKLLLSGTVQNIEDGSVKVVAEGERDALEKLVAYLQEGPLLAHVDDVSVVWQSPEGTFSDFKVIF